MTTKLLIDVIDEYAQKLSNKAGHLQVISSVFVVETKTAAGRKAYVVHLSDTPYEEAIMIMERTVHEYYRNKQPSPTIQ